MRQGVTLLELLVTFGIMLFLMGTIYAIFVHGFSFYGQGSSDVESFQYAVMALEKMSRELQDHTSVTLYSPGLDDLLSPQYSKGIVFVKEYPDKGTVEVIGYYLDSDTKEIMRVLYDPGYDPDVPSTQKEKMAAGARKRLAWNISGLLFQGGEHGLMRIGIALSGTNTQQYLVTTIRNDALLR